MTDPDRPELSAFLDGELDPARAGEIEALIAADPGVRAAFEQLQRADARLRSISDAAAFRPHVRWPEPAAHGAGAWLALPLLLVLLAWTAGKLAPAVTTAVAANAASLLLLIACLTPLALREARGGGPLVDAAWRPAE